METTKLKRFATEARINLMEGVMRRLRVLGFDDKGNVIGKEPELISGATLWRGDEYPEDFHAQWTELARQLRTRGVREVVEEAAYIWFNRLIAIRILAKNYLCDPILIQDETTGMPKLLADARMNMIPKMDAQHRRRFDKLMDDDTKSTEQFSALISAWCRENPIISSCFGSHNDYVELLLPDNITKPNGFLSLLNNTGFIADADYRSAELIGWLYQFYISDRKDEVMAKKVGYTADEIPAATQIFTPNWIVKYMVQNTILPQVDAPEEIIDEAKYLVKNPDAQPCRKIELEDFKVADFACGSGHILNECFDLLFKLYREDGYSRREAIENMFTKNLTGIDIDLRAKQLATFALLLKACQRDESFADARCLPYVLTVPDISDSVIGGNYPAYLQHFFLGSLTKEASEQLSEAFRLLEDALTLGSIIKFDISSSTRRQLVEAMQHWQSQSDIPYGISIGIPAMEFILALTDSYDAIVMNPPYLSTVTNYILRDYVALTYPSSKVDLFAIFMEVAINRLKDEGRYGMINLPSWLTLASFESLRKELISKYHIESMLHMGRGIFGIDWGSVAFIVSKKTSRNAGIYFKLHKRNFQHIYYFHIQELFLKALSDNQFKYNFDLYREVEGNVAEQEIKHCPDGIALYFKSNQSNFSKISGFPICYWVSSKMYDIIENNHTIGDLAEPRAGLQTSDNVRFLRFWYEVDRKKESFDLTRDEALSSDIKWFPHNKGGRDRRWYGNRDYIINFYHDGEELKYWLEHNPKDPTTKSWSRNLRNYPLYFNEGISWGAVTSNVITVRYSPVGATFDTSGPMLFADENLHYFLGLLNSKVLIKFARIFAQGLSIGSGHISKVPFVKADIDIVESIVKKNVLISKQDWDAHETSWDFQTSPLIAAKVMCRGNAADLDVLSEEDRKEILADRNIPTDPNKLEDCYRAYCNHWSRQYHKLHRNEEELNRRFIEIYGLQDELTPEVPLDEVTILQQGEIKIVNNDSGVVQIDGHHSIPCEIPTHIEFQPDVIIKQLISYIVGVWMGRYRLDRPGLNIAHPNPTEDELAEYSAPYGKLKIDVDAIIPILPQDAPFFDNLYNYVRDFLRLAFGEESLVENLNFIEKCLGKRLDIYLQKDFWKDHKKMYQNKPIYWLFSSSKGAFQAIIYAHRMDRYTIEVMRSKYLLPYRSFVEKKIAALDARAAELSTAERKELDRLRKDIAELDEYAQRVEVVAGESAQRDPVFDLDDGIAHNHALFASIATKLK